MWISEWEKFEETKSPDSDLKPSYFVGEILKLFSTLCPPR